jgi:hypothetical protein
LGLQQRDPPHLSTTPPADTGIVIFPQRPIGQQQGDGGEPNSFN